MTTLPDKELAKKLELVHIQMELAEQKKNTASLELLEIWHHQIIEARIYKAANEIPDAPNEIEHVIANIETIVAKTEKRQNLLTELTQPAQQSHPKVQQQQENDNQLSLF